MDKQRKTPTWLNGATRGRRRGVAAIKLYRLLLRGPTTVSQVQAAVECSRRTAYYLLQDVEDSGALVTISPRPDEPNAEHEWRMVLR